MAIINALPDQYVPVMTGATGSTGGSSGLVPAPSAGDNEKCLKGDGTWGTISSLPAVTSSDNGKALRVSGGQWVVQENPVMVGAGSGVAGASGLVPAPSAGGNVLFLRGDGTWDNPPGSKLVVVDLDTVTNTSGSYTHSTTISGVSADMKAVQLELSNPAAFRSTINIVTSTNAVTLTCSSVAGTSTVKVGLLFVATANAITSSEFDVLAGRIGTLSSLTTTAKSSTVAAINELDGDIGSLSSLHTTAKTNMVAATNEIAAKMPIVVTNTFTVTGGATKYENAAITTNSKVFVQIMRYDDGLWRQYDAFPRVSQAGRADIFIRQSSSGDFPADNSVFKLAISIFP